MDWLDPWSGVEDSDQSYRDTFHEQLAREVSRGHALFGLPVELMGRGNGDDCLFKILDGSGRVAFVHLVWQGRQSPPWPATDIYASLEEWIEQHMQPEHREWTDDQLP